MRPLMVLLGSAVVFTATPAFARNAKPVHPQTTCSVTPGSKGSGSMNKRKGGSSLTDKLSSCGGVLEPPAVGDNMTRPPPKTGNSRVIKPRSLPGQQAPDVPKKNAD